MSETTEKLVTTLEPQHLRALQHADSITFHLSEGQGFIRAHRRSEHTATGFDEQVSIYTETRVQNYQRDDAPPPDQENPYNAFHMEHGAPRYDITALTLVRRLRKGDTLLLTWVRGNDNDNNRHIGWHRDELYLGIQHTTGKGEQYLVAVQVGPDNSARMVKRS